MSTIVSTEQRPVVKDLWALHKHHLDWAHHNLNTTSEILKYICGLDKEARAFVIHNWSRECGSPYCNVNQSPFWSNKEEKEMLAAP